MPCIYLYNGVWKTRDEIANSLMRLKKGVSFDDFNNAVINKSAKVAETPSKLLTPRKKSTIPIGISKDIIPLLKREPESFEEALIQFLLSGGKLDRQQFVNAIGKKNIAPYFPFLKSKGGQKLDRLADNVETFGKFDNDNTGMGIVNETISIMKEYPGKKSLSERLKQLVNPKLEITEYQNTAEGNELADSEESENTIEDIPDYVNAAQEYIPEDYIDYLNLTNSQPVREINQNVLAYAQLNDVNLAQDENRIDTGTTEAGRRIPQREIPEGTSVPQAQEMLGNREINPQDDQRKLIESVKNHFGTTKEFIKAGFILPDGSLLDLSEGKHSRSLMHESVGRAFGMPDGYEAKQLFMKAGAVRLIPESGSIEISVNPTSEQLSTIRNFIELTKGRLDVEFNEPDGPVFASYGQYSDANDILSDISDYYIKGRIPRPKMAFSTSESTDQYIKRITDSFDKEIAAKKDELQKNIITKNKKIAEINNRNGLFGDTKQKNFAGDLFAQENDLSAANIAKTLEPFNAQIIRLKAEIPMLESQKSTAIKEAQGQKELLFSKAFYQNAESALTNLPEKGTVNQFKQGLLKNGAKPSELDWLGFDDAFTDLNKSIAKQDVQNWIDENRIDVKIVEKSEKESEKTFEYSEELNDSALERKQELEKWIDDFGTIDQLYYDYLRNNNLKEYEERLSAIQEESGFANMDAAQEELDILTHNPDNYIIQEITHSLDETKYSDYKTPGGTNYKEVLFTLPDRIPFVNIISNKLYGKDYDLLSEVEAKEVQNKFKSQQSPFKSSHFDEPNIVAHIRIQDMADKDGNKVLMIEEIQSDWAQKGKKEGFKSKEFNWDSQLGKDAVAAIKDMDNLGFNSWQEAAQAIIKDKDWVNTFDIDHKYVKTISDWQNAVHEEIKVPDMPFKKTDQWTRLSLRYALKYASENGYDKMVWTTGEQQAERYDLSKSIDEISAYGDKGIYELHITPKEGKMIGYTNTPESKLEDYVGKELARKIIEHQNSEDGKKNPARFEGLDLKVGGEGMKGFYDNIIPKNVKDLTKQETRITELSDGLKVHSIEVTPELKDKFSAPQPLFSKANQPQSQTISNAIEIAQRLNEKTPLGARTFIGNNKEDLVNLMIQNGESPNDIKIIKEHQGVVHGFITGIGVYLNASSNHSEENLIKTFIHEQIHKGLDSFLSNNGISPTEFYNHTYESIGEEGFKKLCDDVDAIKGRREGATYEAYKNESNYTKGKEIYSHLSEKILNEQDLTPVEKTLWQKFVEMIKKLIFGKLKTKVKFTDKDMANIVKASLYEVVEKTDGVKNVEVVDYGEPVAMSESKNQFSFYYSQKEILDAINDDYEYNPNYSENTQIVRKAYDFFTNLIGKKSISKGLSEYINTGKQYNNKDVIIRISDHKMTVSNNRENDYVISFVFNQNKNPESLITDEYSEIVLNPTKKNVDDILMDLSDGFFDDVNKTMSSVYLSKSIPPTKTPVTLPSPFAGDYIRNDPKIINSLRDRISEGLNDQQKPVVELVKLLRDERHGKIDDELSNPEIAERKFRGSVVQRSENYDREIMQPLIDAVASIVVKSKKTVPEIDRYLQARHAEERNKTKVVEHYAKKKKLKIESVTPEEAGYDPKTTNESGFTTEQANEIIKQFEKDVPESLIKDLVRTVHESTTFSLKTLYDAGKIDKSTYEYLTTRWKNYVPLRGYNEGVYMGDYWDFSTNANSNRGAGTKALVKAEGRTSEAAPVLQYIQSIAHNSILMAEKNKYLKAAFSMVRDNLQGNEDLFSLENTYLVDTGVLDEKGNSVIIEQSTRPTKDQIEVKITPADYGRFIEKEKNDQRKVTVFIKGQPIVMVFNDPKIALALKHENVPDWAKKMGDFWEVSKIAPLTRWLSMNYTGLDPNFFIPNEIRDIQLASTKIMAEKGIKGEWLFLTNYALAKGTLIRHFTKPGIVKAESIGETININGKQIPIDKLKNSFMLGGGMTGYINQKPLEQLDKDINKLIKNKVGTDYTKAFKLITHGLENMASTFENSIRFATYITHLQLGKSHSQAIVKAKEVTTNFEKNGAWTGAFAPVYMFSRATINGGYNWAQLAKTNPKAFAGDFAAWMILGAMGSMLFMSDDEKRDEKGLALNKEAVYNDLSDYIKYNYYIYITDDLKVISVPVSFGWRYPYQIGVMAQQMRMGKIVPSKFAFGLVDGAGNAFSPISPTGFIEDHGGFTPRPLVPSFGVPIYDVWSNTNFMGGKVKKSKNFLVQPELVEQRGLYLKNTNPIFIKLTDKIAEAGGMDLTHKYRTVQDPENKQGIKEISTWWDYNPAVIEHLTSGYFGGRFIFGKDLIQMGVDIVKNKPVETSKMPIIKRFIREPFGQDEELYLLERDWSEIRLREERFNITRQGYNKNRQSDIFKELSLNKEGISPEMVSNSTYKSYQVQIDALKEQLKEPSLTADEYDLLEDRLKNLYKKAMSDERLKNDLP